MGSTAYAVCEKQQRCSFQETKRSLRDKLTIEQQSKEQVRGNEKELSIIRETLLCVVYSLQQELICNIICVESKK